ncbi:hypothetical protein [Clostridium sp. L2-50]|uniref:hypothetical protein n=1 Tax=Clostridium sp. L2-50 TaxID=411489 RepID=UPI00015BDD95|nr:hypothetical protein [Clostridium sp. L2-50]EDO57643.1 hypothetical protein CLOL250_01733 [Clostridium sp. L2-50]UEA74552.1 hypothetical protein LK416_12985 [Lachnospiraceae bacterium GAM79]UEA77748.1 hypothetical protein LK424_03065 [Lachnospiraceae bacterium GAM79]
MSFHSLLNSIIDSQSVTKNSLINETGIDRSSFYQILSGKRIPTKDQITSIIRQLDISAADEMALYDAFYLERLGETNYHYLKFTEKCLRVIGSPYIDTNASNNQTPSRSQELQNKLPDNPIDTDQSQAATETILYHSTDEIICGLTKFLIHASKKENNHLQVSLPFDLSSRIKLFSSIQSLITSGKFQNATISQILHFQTKNPNDITEKLDGFATLLESILTKEPNITYNIYYYSNEQKVSKNSGVLFPFYIITDDASLLLNADANKGCLLTDPSLIGLMREEFASVFDHAKPFLSSFSQKELPQFQARSIPAEEVIFIQKHPGACLMVTDDLVEKYVPEEFKETLKQHFHFMQQMNASEGITLDGIREFARNHVISESGFYVEANTSDIINALEQLEARLDRNLFVLDTEKIPVSDNWAFLLYPDQYALLVPNKELDFIICVSDPDIIHALTYTFHSVDFEDYILDNTLVRNEIQKLISENENRVADSTL